MKIEGKVTSPLTSEVKGNDKATRHTGTPAPVPDASAPESVDVKVSALATQLQEIEAQLRTGDGVDAAKVAEIKQAIAEGRFQINPDVIADRLLETVREMVREVPASKP